MAEKQKHTILILEDDQPLTRALSDALVKNGFDVVTSATVEGGIKQLEDTKHIDVIWLDHYLLGTENGIDFVVKVKNHPEWKSIPIFVVSNTASTPSIRSYLELGVSNFYTKSDYDMTQIISDIEATLEKGK